MFFLGLAGLKERDVSELDADEHEGVRRNFWSSHMFGEKVFVGVDLKANGGPLRPVRTHTCHLYAFYSRLFNRWRGPLRSSMPCSIHRVVVKFSDIVRPFRGSLSVGSLWAWHNCGEADQPHSSRTSIISH